MNKERHGTGPTETNGSQAGWSLGGASPEWGPLDLTGGGGKLPPPGDYDAVISDVDTHRQVRRAVDDRQLSSSSAWRRLPRQCGLCSPVATARSDDHRLAEGARLLHRLAAATGTPLDAIKDPFELPGLFIGKPVNLTVAHKERDGVPELVVRTIRPR